jgi:hypothetical protein
MTVARDLPLDRIADPIPGVARSVLRAVPSQSRCAARSNPAGRQFGLKLGKAARLGISGSSAMPHLGQAPGWSWRTFGCIAQV